MRILILCLLSLFPLWNWSQTNLLCTSAEAQDVMLGNYAAATYLPAQIIDHPDSIAWGIAMGVTPDSLLSYLQTLSGFENRNTGSDTVSQTRGIGAARRWVYQKFSEFSQQNDNRLIPAYIQFERPICGLQTHRSPIAVLPGLNDTLGSVIVIEGHMDSRCAGACDTACVAHGADDNGSGSVLVMELARVMSKYSFQHTIVFMLTIGEEQGLYGAEAFVDYAANTGIEVKACLNNDVVGGIICGNTASAPGCPGAGDIDSLNLRVYSFGGYNSPHKGLARYIKLEFEEEMSQYFDIPTVINIMTAEDRSGRGGDHIPFRQAGKPAIRFTSANEHGNGAPGLGYSDHQHTSLDSIGVDTDGNGVIDSFWVDFNYLARNARINGNAAAMAAFGVETPDFQVSGVPTGAEIEILSATQYAVYRIGVRTTSHDFDTVYTMNGTLDTIAGLFPGGIYIFSVASVDSNGIESLFSYELNLTVPTATDISADWKGIQLMPNRPNPFDEKTTISVWVDRPMPYNNAHIRVMDINGKVISELPISLEFGSNAVDYWHGFHASGILFFSLVIDGEVFQSRKMVFTGG